MPETESAAIAAFYDYKAVQSENTAREYRRYVKKYRDFLDEQTETSLFESHSGHAEEFYQWMLEDGYSPATIQKTHSAISQFFKKLDEFGGKRGFPNVSFRVNPAENASPNRLDGMYSGGTGVKEGNDMPLTRHEISKLVDNVPPEKPVRNRLIIKLLYQTGVRRSELVRIKLDHIDREDRSIRIYGKKTEDSRKVWYKPSLDTLLDLWIDGDRNATFYAEESEYLFPTPRQERMNPEIPTRVVKKAAERAGIQETVFESQAGEQITRVTPHMLRKSFGVHFINNGGDISFLMELLGHNNIETTKENYLKFSEKDLKQSARRHGPSL